MTEPRTYADDELTAFAQSIALSVLTKLRDRGVSASDTATVMAIACAEVLCQCHGAAGIEHMRNAADICERQLMGMTQ